MAFEYSNKNIYCNDIVEIDENKLVFKNDTSKFHTDGLNPVDVSRPTIQTCFDGGSVFITGGTGFMGKVLIEKLLRSCPGIVNIYLLLRSKKGVSGKERIKKIIDIPLFDKLRDTDPQVFNKLIPISGDVSEIRLGLSADDESLLIENVSIIFHAAASIRFDDPICTALRMNTRGAREVAELALKMKQLQVLVHVSTVYCNVDKKVIDEIVYPPMADWSQLLKMAETIPENKAELLCKKLIHPLPNTYTFTKKLAEDVMNDYSSVIPVVIYRPSIVIPTIEEPIPGWIDNFNGPLSLIAGCQSGVLRALYSDLNVLPDFIPVDVAIRTMITAAWYRIAQNEEFKNKCLVINGATSSILPIDNKLIMTDGRQIASEIPFENVLWYPFIIVTSNRFIYLLSVFLLHLLPAFLMEGITKIRNKISYNPIKIYRRIFTSNELLHYFLSRQWTFLNRNFQSLPKALLPQDYEDFNIEMIKKNPTQIMKEVLIGIKLYLLKEDSNLERNLKKSRRKFQRIYYLHFMVCFVLIGVLLGLIWHWNQSTLNKIAELIEIYV